MYTLIAALIGAAAALTVHVLQRSRTHARKVQRLAELDEMQAWIEAEIDALTNALARCPQNPTSPFTTVVESDVRTEPIKRLREDHKAARKEWEKATPRRDRNDAPESRVQRITALRIRLGDSLQRLCETRQDLRIGYVIAANRPLLVKVGAGSLATCLLASGICYLVPLMSTLLLLIPDISRDIIQAVTVLTGSFALVVSSIAGGLAAAGLGDVAVEQQRFRRNNFAAEALRLGYITLGIVLGCALAVALLAAGFAAISIR
ncbi:hypothetical protein [Naumannella halotolerans]|uniref:Uncharacterized protein n=1 Tax=Naumannella halotolerans TaxID=993414 RepID=A0A4R7J2G0_9ACTN|nr:hypothetical protein [Naumannella halotolerans]TDT31350.1 hypothetical protein CLV29_2769 [Naumannella halotolerans]